MSIITIKIIGLNKLIANFEKAPAVIYKALDNAVKRSAWIATTKIKAVTPVRTGNLKRGIRPEFRPLVATIMPHNAPYACVFSSRFKVKTEKGLKEIGQIKIGDRILTQDGLYHKVIATPRLKASLKPNLVEIKVEYRKDKLHKLIVTNDHKILVKENKTFHWKESKDLKIGDIVLTVIKKEKRKGIGKKYIKKICKNCGNKYLGQGSNYCSIECRNDVYKINHPQTGVKRKKSARLNIANANIKRLKENPESHPNRVMARLGKRTKPKLELKKWLDNLGIKYYEEYKIGKRFVDFYAYEIKTVFEADGAYWHSNQEKDIERDKEILNILDVKIIHIHFTDYRFSKNIKVNPVKNVYYIQVNPSMDSYVNLDIFKESKIVSVKNLVYNKKRYNTDTKLYDLTVEGVHSFVCSGILISNSFVHDGTRFMKPRPFMEIGARHALTEIENEFNKSISRALDLIAR